MTPYRDRLQAGYYSAPKPAPARFHELLTDEDLDVMGEDSRAETTEKKKPAAK